MRGAVAVAVAVGWAPTCTLGGAYGHLGRPLNGAPAKTRAISRAVIGAVGPPHTRESHAQPGFLLLGLRNIIERSERSERSDTHTCSRVFYYWGLGIL